ncbi:histidine kinase M3YPp [Lecanosticta acicola]|uniref:Histidine kinase M3YPp n=1 Tax=Lecanosticta acicola TaxID=111012 RepID=A0AAI8Z1P8_9PEZI|nr:histidine kinase M3YPp [Lecanosticta acicola]
MDAQYAYLKEHDAEWLEKVLQERMRMRQAKDNGDEGIRQEDIKYGSDRSSAGPFDVTVANPPPDLVISEHAKLIRNHDWSTTSLGPIASWSTELRRMVNMCLSDNKATALWWGPERICLYNEAYTAVLAHKHPGALGKKVFEVWPELEDVPYGHSFGKADRTGMPSSEERVPFYVERAGYFEEVWASWVVIPVPGPNGNLGYYNTVSDVTQEVVYSRRVTTLHLLDQKTSAAETLRDYWSQVVSGLQDNEHEVPFAALYGPAAHEITRRSTEDSTIDDMDSGSQSEQSSIFAGSEWSLEGVLTGKSEAGMVPLPGRVDLDTGTEWLTPEFRSCMLSKTVTVLRKSDGTMSKILSDVAISRAFEGERCDTAVLLPIWSTYQEHRSGFLILGLNTRRGYDLDYQRFVRLLHQQLTTSLSTLVMAEDEAKRARAAARLAARDRIQLVQKLAASEQEAKEKELRFRSMADLAPIGIFEADTEGKVVYANQHFMHFTECAQHGFPDLTTLTNAFVEADREAAWSHWRKLIAGEQVHFECRLDKSFVTDEVFGGERMQGECWVLIAAYAMRHDSTCETKADTIKGVFGCMVDISRQKWMEGFQERQVKEQLERRRQQENFMDSTNHEARNPLAAITLCADDVHNIVRDIIQQPGNPQLTIARDSAAAILESVEIIIACAKHQKRIIDDVLTISKLDSKMLSISPTPVRPVAAVTQALRMFQSELQRSDVALEYTVGQSYEANKVDWVMLDPTRFLQILVNLLTNAIKFTKHELSRKVAVTLEASEKRPTDSECGVRFAPTSQRRPSISIADGGVYLCVKITDTGPGIIDSELENLFQRFQQASPKTYAQYGGSGLGLWISKELSAKLGGQIGVASNSSKHNGNEPNRGSTFAFYVQAMRCPPPSETTAQAVLHETEMEPRSMSVGTMAMLDQGIAAITAHLESTTPSVEKPSETKPPVKTIPDARMDIDKLRPPEETATATEIKTDILIVEDNLVNQRVMRKQLLRAGFRVSVANHGKEALDHIYPTSPASPASPTKVDVVLMDIEMPVMGGLECTRIIRKKESEGVPGSKRKWGRPGRLPILGVTANVRAEQQAAALEAGMDRVVTKPFHMSELLPAIERVKRERA